MEQKLAQLQAKIEANQSISEKLFSLEEPEDVQNFLKELGLEFTIEEIMLFRDMVLKVVGKSKDGELSDDDLDDVSGGVAVTTVCAIVGATAGCVSAGAAVVGATAGVAVAVHKISGGRW